MPDLKELLRGGDPASRSPLSQDERNRMRRHILTPRSASPDRRDGLVVALVVAVIGVIGTGTWFVRSQPHTPPAAPDTFIHDSALPVSGRRQLEFATPGGTRVIWAFGPSEDR